MQASLFDESDSKSYIRSDILKKITEEKESQNLSTPGNIEPESEVFRYSSDNVKIQSSMKRSPKENKLNSLVSKVDLKLPFNNPNVPRKEIVYEQGQNSGDEGNQVHEQNNLNIQDERLINTDKDASNGQMSLAKSEHSQLENSSREESPQTENEEGYEHQSELHKAHLIQTLQAIQYIRTLASDHSLKGKKVNLPPHPNFDSANTTKTIIFDLDETLVH